MGRGVWGPPLPTYAGVVWGNFQLQKLPQGASRSTRNVPVYSRKLPLGATRRTQTVPAFFKIRDPARPAASWGAGRGVRRGGGGRASSYDNYF